jgi:hypothetical protein
LGRVHYTKGPIKFEKVRQLILLFVPKECFCSTYMEGLEFSRHIQNYRTMRSDVLLFHFAIRPFPAHSDGQETDICTMTSHLHRESGECLMTICTYYGTIFKLSTWLTHFNSNRINSSSVRWLWVPISPYAWPANTN